jgi:hypothetical protein
MGPICRADMSELLQLSRHSSGRTSVIGDMDSQVLDIPSIDIGGICVGSWHREM